MCLSPLSFIIALALAIGAFFMTWSFFPAPVYFTEVKRTTEKLKKPAITGNAQLDETLGGIFANKKELRRLSESIVSPKIREPLREILRLLDLISEQVKENPDKVRSLRQFTNYYLPTTVKFLEDYENLEQKAEKGENINTALRKIEEVTSNMTKVFKQEYDDLFNDKIMDISAEVSVMQAMIKENEEML
jgi:5-bromo-4-chloroindolyl phosphate hydrolysis protein